MATYSTKRLFQRLLAIALVLAGFKYAARHKEASAEVLVTPSDVCLFDAEETHHQTITVHGSPSNKCKLQVSTSNDSAIQILSEGFQSDDFLYVKTQGLAEKLTEPDNCPYQYVVLVSHGGNPCATTFLYYEHLEFNLKGNVSIMLKEVAFQQSADDENKCVITDGLYHHTDMNPALPTCIVYWYHDAIVCGVQGSSLCVLDLPRNCNITLGYREVKYRCSNESSAYQRVLIVYPNHMSVLDAAENNIGVIETNAFQNMNTLKTLLLQYNDLRILNSDMFRDLSSLSVLNLRGNMLATLVGDCFQGLTMLSTLDLSENMLYRLPVDIFQALANLKELYLNGNQIEYLNVELFHGLHELHKLNLETNVLTALDIGIFQELENLQMLDLDGNRFKNLNAGLFEGLSKLEVLDLDFNELTTLHVGLFHGLISLREIDADNNQLDTLEVGVFHGLPSLVELDLDVNALSSLDTGCFEDLIMLESLELDSNRLQILDIKLLHGLWNLTILGLAINTFHTLDVNLFQGFASLNELYLHDNYFVTLEVGLFDGLQDLTELALSHNRLGTISAGLFRDLHNLVSLRLDGNRLVVLSSGLFRGLVNLEALYLNDNHIRYLETDIFNDLINLDKLTLQSNDLNMVDSDSLQNTVKLAILDLSDNRLQMIPNITHLRDLILVILNRNKLLKIQGDSFAALEYGVQLLVSQHEICECYVPLNTTCSASLDRSPYLTCYRLLSDRVLVIMMWVISISALCGNMFVLCWRNKHSGKNKVQSLLLRNLAMSDLLMGVYMITIAVADIYYGNAFPMAAETWRTGIICKIAGALSIISSEASVFFVTIISIDRCINIKYPFNSIFKFGTRSTVITIVLVWAFASVLGIVPSILAGKNSDFYDNSHVCVGLPLALIESFSTYSTTQEVASTKYKAHTIEISRSVSLGQTPGMYFSTAIFLGLNCVCYLAIFCCYMVIILEVRKSSKQAGITPEMKDQLKMTAKVTAIVATDFLCWSPIILLGILVQIQVITLPPSVFAWSVTFVLPINSAINPYLYTIADVISNRKEQNEKLINSSNQSMHQQTYRETGSKLPPQRAISSFIRKQENNALPDDIPEKPRRPESNV